MTLLVDATLRMSVVLVIGFALAALCRARAAALRHCLLAAAIVCAACVPLFAAIAPSWHLPFRAIMARTASAPAAPQSPATPAPQTVFTVTTSGAVPAAADASFPTVTTVVAGVWIGGALLGLLALAAGLGRLRRIGSRARPIVDRRWTDTLADVMRAHRYARRVTLLETDRPELVVTWGAIAPKVLVPRAAVRWPADRIRVVLCHELAHIRRADWLVQMAAEIVRAVYWFNPLVWIACRRLRDESEHACDDAVLGLGVDASEYASHLLELARSIAARRRAFVPAQAIVRPSCLERRITAMLNARLDRAPVSLTRRIAAAAAVAAMAIVVAGFAAAAQGTTVLRGTVTDQLGGVLPDAPITLRSLDTDATYQVKSDRAGRYAFAALPSGDYMLRIDGVLGFRPVERRIVLTGASMERNLTLRVGAIQETIRVTDAPPSGEPTPQRPPTPRKPREDAPPCTSDCVGGNIGVPIKLHDVKPIYPVSQTGVGGVVNLKAVIDTTGHVSRVQVVGDANPDLAAAAVAAVSQWEFDPTRLNGVVIETEMNVSVMFAPSR